MPDSETYAFPSLKRELLGAMSHDYGRRVEVNRSWTIYHVFTGRPAEIGTRPMVGLSEFDATSVMLFLNSHNAERRKASFSRHPSGGGSCQH
ncbi:hypothetical protein [Mesorhizobium qingshengii]|uniref:Uncharacterized protein n=1 Tax=Mesorhizobium qingshengii TaxID=1165689 RepID=A0A1G5YFK0_9HYPH|nr:hypothetical protein [Mesorhizobium qingshengii]SDA81333.1 hypothetical protein SAMN02927914_03262 [Mesorhizobium qingshengii]